MPAEVITQADGRSVYILRVAVIIFISPCTSEGAGIRGPAIIVDIRRGGWNILFAVITRIALFAFDLLFPLAFAGLWRIELLGTGKVLATLLIFSLKHGIFEQITLELLLHFDRRQLEQFDRLLQLRSQRQMLGEF